MSHRTATLDAGVAPNTAEPGDQCVVPLPENEALLDALRRDPKRGAELVFQRFSPDVNRIVWRLLGADAEHNDLVQQVFFKVLARWRTVREPERLSFWIMSIAVNTVYEELRRRETRRLLLREWRPSRAHADLTREVEARDYLLAAKSILERLPAAERVVFTLHFVEGQTLDSIAEACGFSHTTAKRRLNSARERFRKMLDRNPELKQALMSEHSLEAP